MGHARTGAAVQAGNRPSSYYIQARPEVAALVPPHCRRVLDVGCGSGHLGQLLKERGHHVTGIELVPEAADEARHCLDSVVTADVETGLPFAAGSFDAVIFADLLEHLVDPWRMLREAAALLSPDGVVVASVPNVQNLDVLRRLVRGRWDYRERGILDRGHLRFFTLETIRDLFSQADLSLTHIGHRYRRSLFRETMCFLTAGRARGYFTRQYLLVGKRTQLSECWPTVGRCLTL
jgi:O-antigen biosynthesis protein